MCVCERERERGRNCVVVEVHTNHNNKHPFTPHYVERASEGACCAFMEILSQSSCVGDNGVVRD